jgi:hypothetical protein
MRSEEYPRIPPPSSVSMSGSHGSNSTVRAQDFPVCRSSAEDAEEKGTLIRLEGRKEGECGPVLRCGGSDEALESGSECIICAGLSRTADCEGEWVKAGVPAPDGVSIPFNSC